MPHLVDIEARAHRNKGRENWLARLLAGEAGTPGSVLVASADDRICGFLAYQRVLDRATLLEVSVHPGFQGRGLGAALLGAALAEMRDCGLRRCELEVRASNHRALALYRSCKFVRDGVRAGYYPGTRGREDAILMSMEL